MTGITVSRRSGPRMGAGKRLRLGSGGQAAVESAIAIPMSMFVVLGVLQMGMMQQARMLSDYAAYKGARAASVGRAECPVMVKAEIAALVPTLGRADSASAWVSTYKQYEKNKRSSLPVVYNEFKIENQHQPFDTPLKPNELPEKIHLRLHYFYQLTIPFADWLIARYYLAERGLESWAGMSDPINPIAKTQAPPHHTAQMVDSVYVRSYFNKGIYVVPLQASWSFRMFSQASRTKGDCQ